MMHGAIASRLSAKGSRLGWSLGGAIALNLLLLVCPLLAAVQSPPVQPRPAASKPSKPPIRPRVTCPTELAPLTTALLKDLPQYINRLSHQRGGSQAGKYAIAASQPEMTPLPVFTSTPDLQSGGLHQTFFTLLERQYLTRQKIDYQNYYWLFLAYTPERGWQLAMLYTREGPYPSQQQPPTELRDATREVPGLAIRQWLRDCHVGAIALPLSGDKPQ